VAQKQAVPSSGKRISIDEAFRKLRPALGPDGAVELINTAMRDKKRLRLFCDGRVVDRGFIRDHLVVKGPGGRGANRRRSAKIVATRTLEKPVKSYNWQMDAKEIEALRVAAFGPTPSPRTPDVLQPPRRRPGPKPKDDWPEEVKAEIVRIALSDPEALRNPNLDGLNKKIRARFGETNRWLPNDPKETEKIIREFLQRVR
jgi:hypothetical protein